MAYESRVIVVNEKNFKTKSGEDVVWAEKIAEVNLSCMGYGNGFTELFTKPINYELFMDDGNTQFDTDMYGEHLKSCKIDDVIRWIEKEMESNDYRRLSVLYGLLSGFNKDQWENIEVIHFGY